MLSLYNPARVQEIHERLGRLQPDSTRLWGTMSVSQAVAHCVEPMRASLGEAKPPRLWIGRLVGGLIKKLAIHNDRPLRRNTPTDPSFVVKGDPDLEFQRTLLLELVDRFHAAGPSGCTTHPHSFFGKLSPDEWATLQYKHIDHHLRQFGT
jgi:hypothetical protein